LYLNHNRLVTPNATDQKNVANPSTTPAFKGAAPFAGLLLPLALLTYTRPFLLDLLKVFSTRGLIVTVLTALA
jgi:hypothetical protein